MDTSKKYEEIEVQVHEHRGKSLCKICTKDDKDLTWWRWNLFSRIDHSIEEVFRDQVWVTYKKHFPGLVAEVTISVEEQAFFIGGNKVQIPFRIAEVDYDALPLLFNSLGYYYGKLEEVIREYDNAMTDAGLNLERLLDLKSDEDTENAS